MAQLRQDFNLYHDQDAEIIVLGPEGPKIFEEYWKVNNLPFIGIPDPERKVLTLFGQEVKLFKWGRMPAMVIVDKKGVARFAHYGHQMSDIPKNEDVLKVLADLNRKGASA